ncbi:MAG: hypothetical protein IJM23_09790 [Lachnospiraceae bacterium]|nr:hypothetical protein [Lachnospiraceae bacterium]
MSNNIKVIKTKEQRIKAEKQRLTRQYKDMPKKKKEIAQGLIARSAYLRVSLEDLEAYLDENGYVEKFKQGKEQEPYDRKRPQADLYISMSTQYVKIMGQLDSMLPKVKDQAVIEADIFDSFVEGREDV